MVTKCNIILKCLIIIENYSNKFVNVIKKAKKICKKLLQLDRHKVIWRTS